MIKVGDKVKTIGWFEGIEATVERVETWEEEGPPSVENHGTIFLCVTKITNPKTRMSWVEIGSQEHFCYYDWQKHLQIIEEEQMIEWQNEPNLLFITQTEAFESAPQGYRLPTSSEFYELQKTRKLPVGSFWTNQTYKSQPTGELLGIRVLIEEHGIDQTDATSQNNNLNFAWYVKENKNEF